MELFNFSFFTVTGQGIDLDYCEFKFALKLWFALEKNKLIEFCHENALIIANTLFQQHKRRFYMWTSPDGQHQNQIDYILCSQRQRSSTQSAKTRPGADCGSDHELLLPNSD